MGGAYSTHAREDESAASVLMADAEIEAIGSSETSLGFKLTAGLNVP
jgi:hypothetical protein